MFKVEVNHGRVQSLCTNGNMTTLQSDITVAIASVYSALKRQDKKIAKMFLDGFRAFFSDDDCVKTFDDYAKVKPDGVEVCEVREHEVEGKDDDDLTVEELEGALKALENIAKKLGVDLDEDED